VPRRALATKAREEPANARFHEVYDDVRGHASLQHPVLIVLADVIVLVRDGERSETTVTPELFHVAKTVAHAPVAVFVASRRGSGHLDVRARKRLQSLHSHLEDLTRSIDSLAQGVMRSNLLDVVSRTRAFLARVLARPRPGPRALLAFAKAVGPLLLRCTRDATRIQLAALHVHVMRILDALTAAERRTLEVVVAGAHQARVRSLAMQYFEKLFDEPPGAERRVSYAEGAETVGEALALVGTRRLDRAIAKAFFGDARRLQRDILGDAAARQLELMPRGVDAGRGKKPRANNAATKRKSFSRPR
jgi:hypothetical protein